MTFNLIYYSDLTSTREAIDLALDSVDPEDLEDLMRKSNAELETVKEELERLQKKEMIFNLGSWVLIHWTQQKWSKTM